MILRVSECDPSSALSALRNGARGLTFCHAVSCDEPAHIKTKIGRSTPDCVSFHSSRPLLRSHWSVPLPSSLWFPGVRRPQRQATTAWTTFFVLWKKQGVQKINTSKTPSQVFMEYWYTPIIKWNFSGRRTNPNKIKCLLFAFQGLSQTLDVTPCLACPPTAPAAA